MDYSHPLKRRTQAVRKKPTAKSTKESVDGILDGALSIREAVDSSHKESPHLTKVKKAITKFEDAQNKHRSFGATDTEPDGVFHSVIKHAVATGDHDDHLHVVPQSHDEWQLYDLPGAGKAAKSLTAHATRAHKVISHAAHKAPHRDAMAVREYLRDYAWRVDMPAY